MIGTVAQEQGREMFSFFRTPLPDDAPTEPGRSIALGDSADVGDSGALVTELLANIDAQAALSAARGPTLGPRIPINKVGPGQPYINMAQDGPDNDDFLAARAQFWNPGVPMPSDFKLMHQNNDRISQVWQPSTDRLWELYNVTKTVSVPIYGNQVWQYTPLTGQTGGSLEAGLIQYQITMLTQAGGYGAAETIAGKTSGLGAAIRSLTSGSPSPPDNTKITLRWIQRDNIAAVVIYRKRPSDANWTRLITLTPATNPTFFNRTASGYPRLSWQDTGGLTPENSNASPPTINTTTGSDWRCVYGGPLYGASSSPGPFRDLSSGVGSPQNYQWGSSASRCVTMAGLISKRDLARGVIDHLMKCAMPNTWIRYPVYAYPAQGKDGLQGNGVVPDNVNGLPYGARLRIKAVSAGGPNIASLNLGSQWAYGDTRRVLANAFAKALQDYGMMHLECSGDTFWVHCTSAIPDGHGWRPGQGIGDPGEVDFTQYGLPDDPYNPTWEKAAMMAVFGNAMIRANLEIVQLGWAPGLPVGVATTPCTNSGIPCPLGGQ